MEVDLEYPDELHDLHNDYPLAPEKIKVSADMLSKYCSDIAKKYDIKMGDVNKVVPILKNKTKYIVRYENLLLYVSLGLQVTKIHKILKFNQSCWMKEYIDFNTKKRMSAANNFEKNFFKLMINSVYGKAMENLGNRINVKLVNKVKSYLKWVAKPNFVSQKIFSENFAALHVKKLILKLNKPIYVGFSVLEISKTLMYDWYYNYFKKKFDCKLLFTDTDSLVYEFKGERSEQSEQSERGDDIYEKIYEDRDLYDFSDYARESKYYDDSNK